MSSSGIAWLVVLNLIVAAAAVVGAESGIASEATPSAAMIAVRTLIAIAGPCLIRVHLRVCAGAAKALGCELIADAAPSQDPFGWKFVDGRSNRGDRSEGVV